MTVLNSWDARCENTTRLAIKQWAYLKVCRRHTNNCSQLDLRICSCWHRKKSCEKRRTLEIIGASPAIGCAASNHPAVSAFRQTGH